MAHGADQRGRRALELREAGHGWQSIADQLGLSSAGAAYNVAARERDPDYWRKRASAEEGAFFPVGDAADPAPVNISPSDAEDSIAGGGPPPTAPCYACGEDLPVGDFASDPSKASGHSSICKACDRRKAKAYYRKNREAKKTKARERARRLREEGR